jgi:DinB superfamily
MIFETLYWELAGSTEMIRALLAGLNQEDARQKPSPADWSILEVVCHLYDEECEDFREHLDFILNRPIKEWHSINPEGWVTERSYNQKDFGEMQGKFFSERAKSLVWLKSIAGANWDTSFTSEFGSMLAGEMLASWIAHDNLHIRQLTELRRYRIENISKPFAIVYAGEW